MITTPTRRTRLTGHLLERADLRQQVVLRLGECERALEHVFPGWKVVQGPVHTAQHGQKLRHQLVVAQLLVGLLQAAPDLEPGQKSEKCSEWNQLSEIEGESEVLMFRAFGTKLLNQEWQKIHIDLRVGYFQTAFLSGFCELMETCFFARALTS